MSGRWQLGHLAPLALACLFSSAVASAGQESIVAGLTQLVERGLKECVTHSPKPCAGRDTTNAALAAMLLSNGTATSESMAFLRADGPVPGLSFDGTAWAPLWYEYQEAFDAKDRQYLFDGMNASITLQMPSEPDVSYSNIYFMQMCNAILFSEVVGGERGVAGEKVGLALLRGWLEYAGAAGNHEFASPTYYWVQLNALNTLFMYTTRTTTRQAVQRILDHIWADVAAHYFRPAQTMAGPHSRDYDFLYGHGALMVYLYASGLSPALPSCEYRDAHCERADNLQNVFVLLSASRPGRGYQVPASILQLSTVTPRTVSSKWIGQDVTANGQRARFADRYTHFGLGSAATSGGGAGYAMGTASQDYITNTHSRYFPCPQDKLFALDLAVPNMSMTRPLPTVTIVPDYLDSPYGHSLEPHTSKPSHLALHPGIVQKEGVVLATLALNPNDQLDGFNLTSFSNLSTSVILPAIPSAVEAILINGKPFELPLKVKADHTVKSNSSSVAPFRIPLPLNSTVALATEYAGVAIRTFGIDGAHGFVPRLYLAGDADGLSLGAMRLVAYHFLSGDPSRTVELAETHVRAGFLISASSFVVAAGGSAPSVSASLAALSQQVADASITSQDIDAGGGAGTMWRVQAELNDTLGQHADLFVERNLTCSEVGGHTAWNCLTQRKRDGFDIVPDNLRMNGVFLPPLPPPISIVP